MTRIKKVDVPSDYSHKEWVSLRATMCDQWFILKEYLLYTGSPTHNAELVAYDYLGVSYMATPVQIKTLVQSGSNR